MNPLEATVLNTIESAKGLFDIPDDVTYLNCANMATQLRSITQAGLNAVRAKATPWELSAPEWFSGAEQLRTLAARVLGTESAGVALVPAASYAIAIAAANLPFSSGRKIVLLHQEFPSNVYAWRELAKKKGGCVVTVQRGGRTELDRSFGASHRPKYGDCCCASMSLGRWKQSRS